MVSEFMFFNKMEKAEIIFDMVNDLMKETHLPKEICMTFIAKYKGFSTAQIKNYVKLHNPNFYYFAVMYNQEGKLLSIQDIDREISKIINKNIKPILDSQPKDDQRDLIKFTSKVLKEFYENHEW